jgi:hypothetical protein
VTRCSARIDFEGDGTLERGVEAAVDLAHRAAAEQRFDPHVAYGASDEAHLSLSLVW